MPEEVKPFIPEVVEPVEPKYTQTLPGLTDDKIDNNFQVRNRGEWKLINTITYSADDTKTFNVTGGSNKVYKLEYDLDLTAGGVNQELRMRINGITGTVYWSKPYNHIAETLDPFFHFDFNQTIDRRYRGYLEIGGASSQYNTLHYLSFQNTLFSTFKTNNACFIGEVRDSSAFDLSSIQIYITSASGSLTGTIKVYEREFLA